jgi:hypothetical protein
MNKVQKHDSFKKMYALNLLHATYFMQLVFSGNNDPPDRTEENLTQLIDVVAVSDAICIIWSYWNKDMFVCRVDTLFHHCSVKGADFPHASCVFPFCVRSSTNDDYIIAYYAEHLADKWNIFVTVKKKCRNVLRNVETVPKLHTGVFHVI